MNVKALLMMAASLSLSSKTFIKIGQNNFV